MRPLTVVFLWMLLSIAAAGAQDPLAINQSVAREIGGAGRSRMGCWR